jgi:hypothetical protein
VRSGSHGLPRVPSVVARLCLPVNDPELPNDRSESICPPDPASTVDDALSTHNLARP